MSRRQLSILCLVQTFSSGNVGGASAAGSFYGVSAIGNWHGTVNNALGWVMQHVFSLFENWWPVRGGFYNPDVDAMMYFR